MTLIIKKFPLGVLQTNCYVIHDKEDSFCLVVDPGENPESVIDYIGDRKVDYILLTHTHYDHISGLCQLKKYTGASVAVHHIEASWLTDSSLNMSIKTNKPIICEWPDILLHGDEIIRMESVSVKVIHTPGHSPGGVSYLINNYVLTGDTLLSGLIGTTDIPQADRKLLIRSIKEKLFTMDKSIRVLPGHGEETSIGFEKEYNVFPKVKSYYPSKAI